MPMTLGQMEAAILSLQNETRRLNTVTERQAKQIAALEQASGSSDVQQVVELLRPIAAYTEQILQVQAGAMGVRP